MIIDVGAAANDGSGDPLRDAFRKINASQAVISRTTDIPASPANGDLYIVPAAATGAWAGQDDNLAWYNGTSWEFFTPAEGWRFWVNDSDALFYWSGSAWTLFSPGGNGSAATLAFQGFRARAAATQAIAAATETDVVFGTEIFDTESAFAANQFTVPASLNGKYMVFSAGVRMAASENAGLSIDIDTGGGFSRLAQEDADGRAAANVTTGAVLVTTGDIVKVVLFTSSVSTVQNDPQTFFAGHVVEAAVASLPVAFKGFRAYRSSTFNTAVATRETIVFNTEDFDTGAGYDNTTGIFTVPASFDGLYMAFMAGYRATLSGSAAFVHIEQSTDGGTTWREINTSSHAENGNGIAACGGPVLLTENDQYRVQFSTDLARALDVTDFHNFFSGFVIETSEDSIDYVEDTSASRTLTGADFKGNRFLEMNNAGAVTLTVNTGLVPQGPLTIIQGGAGQITVGGTATIESKLSADKSNGQQSSFTLIPTNNADTYKMIGDITT